MDPEPCVWAPAFGTALRPGPDCSRTDVQIQGGIIEAGLYPSGASVRDQRPAATEGHGL